MTDRAYRLTPGCNLGCPRCEVLCAVTTRMRDDLLGDLARVEAALREHRPATAGQSAQLH